MELFISKDMKTNTRKILGLSCVPTGSAYRERYQAKAVSTIGGISTRLKKNINNKMTLNQTDVTCILSMECQTVIDNILLQSDVPVDLLDIKKTLLLLVTVHLRLKKEASSMQPAAARKIPQDWRWKSER